MLVRLPLQVRLRGLATWNDRLQRDQPIVFDEWHEVHVIVTLNDEDPLTAVSLLIRVFKDVHHVLSFAKTGAALLPVTIATSQDLTSP
jgi:hypothetical protein